MLGYALGYGWRPMCSVIYAARDSAAQRLFFRWADWYFDEPRHCRKMHMIFLVGRGCALPPEDNLTR